MIVGQRDYAMRFWVRPDKLANRGLRVNDLAGVSGEQNIVAEVLQVGQPPQKSGTQIQDTENKTGRLDSAAEEHNTIARTMPDGSHLRMKDVAFFFQAEDGIRDGRVTGVQTCALPI